MDIPLLTSGEAKVYKALVELGESSIGNVIKTSGVSHSKVYNILERLAQKGLVSSIIKKGKQHFSAASPDALRRLIEDEQEKIKEQNKVMSSVIDQLKARQKIRSPKSVLSSFEGIKGMKNLLDLALRDLGVDDEILILGTPRKLIVEGGGYLKAWQKERIKKKAVCKIIADIDAPSWHEKWWLDSKKKKLTHTVRSTSISPAYLVITNKSVTTIYAAGNIFSFRVEHLEIAQRYKAFFLEYWKGLV